jgi:hypothetical protein
MNFWKLSTFVLTGCLGAVAVYGLATPAHADPQPKMQAALGALEAAKTNLENASSDKGGHRVKAIAATKEAIEQTKKGIAFDNAHDGEKK